MISVIVCTYNRDKFIYHCLECLSKNKTKADWELLLVDNNSTDNTANECRRYENDFKPNNYRYIKELRQGLSHARNRGIDEANGDWLVFLDDDSFVENNYLEDLHQYIQSMPDLNVFGGKIIPLFESGKAPDWLCKWNQSWVSAIDLGKKVKLFSNRQFPVGANMGFTKKVATECGYFNPKLGRKGNNLISGEEKDYFNRIKSMGYKIHYLPNLIVKHCIPPQRTTKEYISRFGLAIGQSEKIRTQNISTAAYTTKLFIEAIKWCVTIALFLFYTIIGKQSCANSLITFRTQVTKGLTGRY